MKEEGGYVVYENQLLSSYEMGMGALGSITRDSVHELSFQCRYFGSEVVSLVAEVNTVPPPLPVAATGPLRVELRLANGQCDAKGCSDANVYSSYYDAADYPVTKVLRDPVYVEVCILERTNPNIVLLLEHCWATSTSSPLSLPQWSLLVDGCPYHDDRYLTTLVPVDGSSGLPNPTHYKRFIIKMFTFVDAASLLPQKETVFIHCSMEVCHPSATDRCESRCGRQSKRGCEPPPSSGRHAINGVPSTEEIAVVTRETAMVSSEKIVLVAPQPAAPGRRLSDSEVPQSLSYGLLGVAASAVLAASILVLTMVWRFRSQMEAFKL
ncbi:hypothetical protein AAFF_G00081910 [Aldrovandia affinis]|uniref:ZP domain-containing protein n=1 Tax=Aldrovandia affinis TaxID=143900 RepID=A0AAD7WZB0_9TELE|nr:hypothetical protein AAFF_G00081910 [Aldrovandia affinis]